MRIRHKVPSIFSLSMVDMLCCALGCVILVWLLNAKVSEDDAEEREQKLSFITNQAQADREESAKLLADARVRHDQATAQTRALRADLKRAEEEIARLRGLIASLGETEKTLRKDLTDEKDQVKDLRGKLALSVKRSGEIDADLKTATGTVKTLIGDVTKLRIDYKAEREKAERLQKLIDEKLTRLAALEKKLDEAGSTRKTMESTLTARDKELTALRLMRERYEKLLEREKALDRKILDQLALLAEADRTRTKLEKEKTAALSQAETEKLALDQLRKLRLTDLARFEKEKLVLKQAADNRFAGITLTGKRAIFLVDTSGSMTMLDQKTEAPGKWLEVCRTVAQLMRSLPELEKYQVIGFAKEVSFPLGSRGQWLENDPRNSPDQALKTLLAIKPAGGTNMYSALDAAFQYRDRGLDTVYVLSDGLPNQGEGLTAAQKSGLSELERGAILGKHIRTTLKKKWNVPTGRQPAVKINTIGFFFESPDLGAFLLALARENEGSFVGMSRP